MEVASWSVTRRYSVSGALGSWCGSRARGLGRATLSCRHSRGGGGWTRVLCANVWKAFMCSSLPSCSAPAHRRGSLSSHAYRHRDGGSCLRVRLLHAFLLVQEQLGSADDGCGATAAAGGSNTGGGTAATARAPPSRRHIPATSTMLADTVSRVRRNDASLRQLKLPGVLSRNTGGAGAGAAATLSTLPNIMDLASALRVNNTLRELDLSGNALGSRGAPSRCARREVGRRRWQRRAAADGAVDCPQAGGHEAGCERRCPPRRRSCRRGAASTLDISDNSSRRGARSGGRADASSARALQHPHGDGGHGHGHGRSWYWCGPRGHGQCAVST